MAPSDTYLPVMDTVREKIHLSKVVIEFMTQDQDATYEDLLNKVQTTVPPQGIATITEDSLLRHAQWIVDQVIHVIDMIEAGVKGSARSLPVFYLWLSIVSANKRRCYITSFLIGWDHA